MIYIGIDPSLTGTGIVVLDEQGNVLDKDLVSTKPSKKIEARYDDILDVVSEMVLENHAFKVDGAHVVIEGLSFGSRGASMLELAGLHYLIRYYLSHKDGVTISIVPPQALKKWVCGKGNVKKEQMILQTYKKWGLEFQDNNICDAYCLARYAMAQN